MGLIYEELEDLANAKTLLTEAVTLFEAKNSPKATEARQDLDRVRHRLGEE